MGSPGTIINLLDPPFLCPDAAICKSRFVELVSFGPKLGNGAAALTGDQSSDQVGDIERIQFVVSNVRNTLLPGQIPSPMDSPPGTAGIFGVQIYKTQVVNGISEIMLTYYNNRVNDPKLNQTLQPWFSGTSNRPITLHVNKMWQASAEFFNVRTNSSTDLIFKMKTFSAIPPGGAIRFWLPSTLKELAHVNKGASGQHKETRLRIGDKRV